LRIILNKVTDAKIHEKKESGNGTMTWIIARIEAGVRIERAARYAGALLLVAAMLALAACGSGVGNADNDGEKTQSGQNKSRVIKHAMGEAEISGTPERVVVLDTGELDSAITLGVKPVGSVEAVEGMGFPSYLEDTGDIENVGTIEQPNLEKIATLKPDLILSSKLRHEAIYDQLSEIAPTVFSETTGVTWKENFELHAKALNKTEEARQVEQDYEQRIEQFQQAMGDRLDNTEVSVVRFLPGDTRIYQKESFIGTILEDTGLPRPKSQDVDEFAILNASAELIPKMGGDAVFVTVYGPEDDTTKQKITSDPLWQKLDAVQEGRVYEVSDDLWMLGIGYTAADGVIDDLEEHLVEE
jgi:iron complex transport system substrate-binding protein